MTNAPTTALRNLETLLADGLQVVDITSNDAHIVVTLRDGERTEMVTLDAGDARRLIDQGWLDAPPMLA